MWQDEPYVGEGHSSVVQKRMVCWILEELLADGFCFLEEVAR